MRKVETYEEAEAKGALRIGGMISNLSWTAEELRKAVGQKTLFLEECPYGKLWVVRQENRNQLFYQINRTQAAEVIPPPDPLPGNCAAEILFSDTQGEKKNEDRTVLEKLGFSRQGSALFLSRIPKEGEPDEAPPAFCRNAQPEDTGDVAALYDVCFDRLADAVPGREELAEYIRRGTVKVIRVGNRETAGTALVEKFGRRRLIRHVAVAPEARKRGYGTALMKAAMEGMAPGERALLWVKEENTAAVCLYRSLGFEPTGRRMEIWVKR